VCISAADASSKLEGSLENNVLQTVVKIPNLIAALPDVLAAVRILEKLVARKLDTATIRDILKLATSTNLQANFVWRPYKDLLIKFLPVMAKAMPSLLETKDLGVGYGSFSYEFLKEFGRERVSFTARTKIVLDVSTSGLASAILGLDSMGLLPMPSRLWDLLPFTFLVNWYTGIGRAIRREELSSVMNFLQLYCVHTYSFVSPFTLGELDRFKASSSDSKLAGLKVYFRDVSLYYPLQKSTRFAFNIPTGTPRWDIIGSLVYQLFLSR
jgi:hypothetical protein